MQIMFFIFLLLGLSFSQEICIKLEENTSEEPYASVAVIKTFEKAIFESGFSAGCSENSKLLKLYITDLEEVPIAYTPQQRVSTYTLILRIKMVLNGVKKEFSLNIPYSIPFGGLGDIPRRQALEDLMDKLYPSILNTFMELKDKGLNGR